MKPTLVTLRTALAVAAALLAVLGASVPARAISTFSRQYGLSCEQCHTIVPMLNSFGQGFKNNGYRIAGRAPRGTFPVSATVSTVYTTERGDDGLGKLVLDDARMQAGGPL